MAEASKDTPRTLAVCMAIVDGRDLVKDFAAILVTTEHAVATILIVLMGNPRRAAAMLNEGLLQGIEDRLPLYVNKEGCAI